MNRDDTSDPRASTMGNIVMFLCLFLSGMAGAIYVVGWAWRAALVFGSTTFAVGGTLSAILLGVAAGGYFFGRIGLNHSRPLRLYAILQVSLGVLAVLTLFGFNIADAVYGVAYRALSQWGVPLAIVRFLIAALVILPPAMLVGSVLPLFSRYFVRDQVGMMSWVGLLYGVIKLGAAVGALTAGLVLIPAIGIMRTLLIAAVVSLLCGLLVAVLRLPTLAPAEELPAGRRKDAPAARMVTLLFFGAGFVALGSGVLWERFLSLLMPITVDTYMWAPAVALTGIAAGSMVAGRLFNGDQTRAVAFSVIQMLSGLVLFALMTLPVGVWQRFDGGFWTVVLALLPPSVLWGASFPLAVRMINRTPDRASLNVGRMMAAGALGGIIGGMAIGFFGIPRLGMEACLLFLSAVSLVIGFAAWIVRVRVRPWLQFAPIALAMIIWITIPRVNDTRVPGDFLGPSDQMVDFEEGLASHLTVIQEEDIARIEIDGRWQGQNTKTHHIMAAHIPMLLHPGAKDILVVGLGSGQTASRFVFYDIGRLDCVDIEPAVFDMVREHFDSAWMDDERTTLIHEDGRSYIAHTARSYDVISLDAGTISRPGVVFPYTSEFFQQAREALNVAGLITMSMPLADLSLDQVKRVLATFRGTFTSATLWYNASELLVVGANTHRLIVGGDLAGQINTNDRVRMDLEYSYWGGTRYSLRDPLTLLAGFLMGPDGLSAMTAGRAPFRDDRPMLDEKGQTEMSLDDSMAILQLLGKHVEPVTVVQGLGISSGDAYTINEIRAKNLGDIATTALIREVRNVSDAKSKETLLNDALRWNEESVMANRMQGGALSYQRRYDEARDYYLKALELQPNDARACYGLAVAMHQSGDLARAIAYYRETVQMWPDNARVHNNLGSALAQFGDLEAAEKHLEEALRLNPDYGSAKRNLGWVRESMKHDH